jgi:membrane associated rhomboid family serine protease
MAVTLVLGLTLGDVTNPLDRETQQLATVHRLSGIAAALAVVLVNSFVVTYFIGTSRWCKEVVEAYSLAGEPSRRSTLLKRRTFPLAVVSMLTVVAIAALGGAADPGAALRVQPLFGLPWAKVHLAGAMTGLALIGYSFYMQWINIEANRQCIANILGEVRRIRIERGLEVEGLRVEG